jgi:ATP-dependent phosphofructokinase / diphosphate-dependent phosphofructokinase
MVKKVVCFALGGHIATQNTSFKTLAQELEPRGYELYGGVDGFKAFDSGDVYRLKSDYIPDNFAGFVSGAGRASLPDKEEPSYDERISQVVDFFKKGEFDVVVGSGGDDHGMQIAKLEKILKENRGKIGRDVMAYVINKTMDNDLGGTKPYTDFTNGFHTAVSVGVESMKNHFAGAWTNNLPYLISPFGRDANWVGLAMSYFGHADLFVHGELPDGHSGHSIERIHDLLLDAQDKNEKKYGRRFAMAVVAEGARISGIDHADRKLIDVHGHHKLNPEALVSSLKRELELKYGMKTQTAGVTYEMRNHPATNKDKMFAKKSAKVIANAILEGRSGVESCFKIGDGVIYYSDAPIEKVSEKRFASYHPTQLMDYNTLRVTSEIGGYYDALFGKIESLRSWLPGRPKAVNVFGA